MLVKTFGCALIGIDAITVTIEVNIDRGINFYLVGLPDNAVKESQQRIEAAITNLGYYYPHKRIVINMAPADIRKEGSAYDLPIAIGIMAAAEQINTDLLERFIIMGELSLDGTINPIKGTLPIAIKAKKDGFRGLIVPKENAREAAVVEGLEVYGVETMHEVVAILNGNAHITPVAVDAYGDGPFTQAYSNDAPSRLGEFFGLNIIRSFFSNNEISLQDLMQRKDLQNIFQDSGYKPKK